MKGKFLFSYQKQESGETRNVYSVHGTPEEIEAFRGADTLGKEDEDGNPTWNTSAVNSRGVKLPNEGELKISAKGNVYMDTQELENKLELSKMPGAVGERMADEIIRLYTFRPVQRKAVDAGAKTLKP